VIKISYDEFVEFHKKHPDMDNTEYYSEFPDVNKSTIRSWKSRVNMPKTNIPMPTKQEAKKFEGAEENEKYLIDVLMNQTNSKPTEFEGIDNRSKLLILKNRKRALDEENANKKPTSNSGILPKSATIGQITEEIGLSKYITFDKNQNEIRMEIPLSKLLDPEQNKALRE